MGTSISRAKSESEKKKIKRQQNELQGFRNGVNIDSGTKRERGRGRQTENKGGLLFIFRKDRKVGAKLNKQTSLWGSEREGKKNQGELVRRNLRRTEGKNLCNRREVGRAVGVKATHKRVRDGGTIGGGKGDGGRI